MTRFSQWLLVICIAAGTVVLCGLGYWQVQRLLWKEALIAEVEARIAASAKPLAEMEVRWAQTDDVDYWPVSLSGRYDHNREQYFYTTLRGAVGWNVYTPLILDDGRVAWVNRGFVPDQLRDPQARSEGQIEGHIEVTGLARNPLYEKPNRFMPDNEPHNRIYFWKSIAEMTMAANLEADTLLPFFIDAGASQIPGDWPRGGTTHVTFPNNHLQYAITWFGLALALVVVGGMFFFSRRQRGPRP